MDYSFYLPTASAVETTQRRDRQSNNGFRDNRFTRGQAIWNRMSQDTSLGRKRRLRLAPRRIDAGARIAACTARRAARGGPVALAFAPTRFPDAVRASARIK